MTKTCMHCGADNMDQAVRCHLCLGPLGATLPSWPHTELISAEGMRSRRLVWARIVTLASAVSLAGSVVGAYAYPPSQSLFLYLISTFVKAELTRMMMGTIWTLIFCALMFFAAILMYCGNSVVGGALAYASAIMSIMTGGGFMAGLVLGMIGGCLAILEK